MDGKLSKILPTNKGIRQGDSLSPLLFNILMNDIILELKGLRGFKIGNKNVNVLCYADDTVLIADSEDSLQRLLYKFAQTCDKCNLKISTKKTKVLTVSKEPIRCKLQLYDKVVEQVNHFQYLGVMITSHKDLIAEVNQQIVKASRISGSLNDTIWNNKYLQLETKTRIYKTVVRPILTYGAETRAETTRSKQLINTVEMKTLRKIVGKTRLDKIKNADIRNQCQIQEIGEWVETRRSQWAAHVSRMPEDRMTRIVRDSIPVGKRSPGRPKRRWSDSLELTGL